MECTKIFWFLSLFILFVVSGSERYSGDQVLTLNVENSDQLDFLRNLEKSNKLDWWSEVPNVGGSVDIHVTSQQLDRVKRLLESNNIEFTEMIEDVQAMVNSEKDGDQVADFLTRFATQPEIYRWLENIEEQCGDRCTLMSIGTSVEGTTLKAMKITDGSSQGSKPAVVVDGGIHAREWISPVFVNNMIDKLVNRYPSSRDIKRMLRYFDWYIIPLLNPDGYRYTHDEERLWRKNRAVNYGSECKGVDLNRNFGYEFGGEGTSNDSCSEIYRGPSAFSEPESRALRDLIKGLDVKVYLTFHSYGKAIVFPWGYDAILAPTHDDLQEVASVGVEKIDKGRKWIANNSALVFGPIAGASDDWAYGSANVKYSYTIELHPLNPKVGFLLPESKISKVVSSVWPGVKAMITRIIQKEKQLR